MPDLPPLDPQTTRLVALVLWVACGGLVGVLAYLLRRRSEEMAAHVAADQEAHVEQGKQLARLELKVAKQGVYMVQSFRRLDEHHQTVMRKLEKL